MNIKKIISFALLSLFAVSIVLPLVPETAFAASSAPYTRIDYKTIRSNDGHYFINNDPASETTFTDESDTDGCKDFINLKVKETNSGSTADTRAIASQSLHILKPQKGTTGSCSATQKSVDVKNHESGQTVTYYWISKNKIGRYEVAKTPKNGDLTTVDYKTGASASITAIPGISYTLNKDQSSGSKKVFVEDTGSDCRASLTINGSNLGSAVFMGAAREKDEKLNFGVYIRTDRNNWGNTGQYLDARYVKATSEAGVGCYTGNSEGSGPASISISHTENASRNANDPAANPAAGGGGLASNTSNDEDSTPSCRSGGGLSWIMCEIVEALAESVDTIYVKIIKPFMVTPPISATGDTAFIYDLWSSFRVFGNIFLIIALLVIVFGQSIGGGLIDAYSAKKILPRLLVAAILINLSFYIVAALVDLTNIVGNGIAQLLMQPFDQADVVLSLGAGGAATLGLGTLVGIGGAAGAIWAVGAIALLQWLLFFILFPALIAFIGILATIIIRSGLIILLVAISPVAFALYCLPNTEKYFRQWWNVLFRTLLVYPIIATVFAIANILAATISQISGGIESWLADLMAVIALVVPLFLIPFSFKIAGGIMGQISSISQGIQTRAQQSGFMKRSREKAGARVKEQGAESINEGISKLGNTRRVQSLINKGGAVGGFAARTVASADQRQRILSAEKAKNPRIASIQEDDNALRAQTYSSAAAAFKGMTEVDGIDAAEARRAIAAVQAAAGVGGNGFGGANAINAAQRMIDTGTAVNDLEDLSNIIARSSGGNRDTIASLAGYSNAKTKAVGRHDLAPSFTTLNDLSLQAANLGSSNSNGGAPATLEQAANNAWNSASLYQHANDKSSNLKAHVKHFQKEIQSGDPARIANAAVFLRELKAMKPNASGDNANVIEKALNDMGGILDQPVIDPSTGRQATRRVRVADRDDPNSLQWQEIPITLGETVAQRSREYERPDPNNIQ